MALFWRKSCLKILQCGWLRAFFFPISQKKKDFPEYRIYAGIQQII